MNINIDDFKRNDVVFCVSYSSKLCFIDNKTGLQHQLEEVLAEQARVKDRHERDRRRKKSERKVSGVPHRN